MKSLKRFIEKKKADSKFSSAGEGRKLTDDRKAKASTSSGVANAAPVRPQSASSTRAGAAALARIEADAKKSSAPPKSKTAAWKSEGSVPVASDSAKAADQPPAPSSVRPLYPAAFRFCCPFCHLSHCGDAVMQHVNECLVSDLQNDAIVASVLMIHCLNNDTVKRAQCVEYLCKYLTNIIAHPEEAKYRNIKRTNKIFQERVAPLMGVDEFLVQGCGFAEKDIPVGDDQSVPHFAIDDLSPSAAERLQVALDVLQAAEPLSPTLDRQAEAFTSQMQNGLPDASGDFFRLTPTEVKQEQSLRSKHIEDAKQLRTKAMRDADKAPHAQHNSTGSVKYTWIRIKFPDGVFLQGAFYASDALQEIINFVKDCSQHDWIPFSLSLMGGGELDPMRNLLDIGLVPAALLLYSVDDKDIEGNLKETGSSEQQSVFLKQTLFNQSQLLSS